MIAFLTTVRCVLRGPDCSRLRAPSLGLSETNFPAAARIDIFRPTTTQAAFVTFTTLLVGGFLAYHLTLVARGTTTYEVRATCCRPCSPDRLSHGPSRSLAGSRCLAVYIEKAS